MNVTVVLTDRAGFLVDQFTAPDASAADERTAQAAARFALREPGEPLTIDRTYPEATS